MKSFLRVNFYSCFLRNNEENKEHLFAAVICSVIMEFVYYYFFRNICSNIVQYLIGIVLFFVVFFVACILLCFVGNLKINRNKTFAVLVYIGGSLFFVLMYHYEVPDETSYFINFIRHRIPSYTYFILFFLFTIVVFLHLYGVDGHSLVRRGSICRVVFCTAIVFMEMGSLCVFNPYKEDLYHLSVYADEILKVLDGIPFGDNIRVFYGFYGLFFIIPVKLFSLFGINMWQGIVLTIAFACGIALASEYWALNRLIRNDAVFYLAVAAISFMSFQLYQVFYLQLWPHRFVAPAIMLAWLAWLVEKDSLNVLHYVVSYCLGSVGILWNTETGLVSVLVCSFALVYLEARNKRNNIMLSILKNSLFSFCSMMVAWAIVNVYTIGHHGSSLSFRQVLVPAASSQSKVIGYSVAFDFHLLETPFSVYFIMIAVMCSIVCFCFFDTLRIRLTNEKLIILLASVMGIGLFTYYMHDPLSNKWPVSLFQFVLILAYVLDCWCSAERNKIGIYGILSVYTAISWIICCILVMFSLGAIATFGETMSRRIETAWDIQQLDEFVNPMKDLPDDTQMVGMGLGILAKMLNRKSGEIIIPEFASDDTLEVDKIEKAEYFQAELINNNYKHIFVANYFREFVPEKYALVAEFQYYNGGTYSYYELDERLNNQ